MFKASHLANTIVNKIPEVLLSLPELLLSQNGPNGLAWWHVAVLREQAERDTRFYLKLATIGIMHNS